MLSNVVIHKYYNSSQSWLKAQKSLKIKSFEIEKLKGTQTSLVLEQTEMYLLDMQEPLGFVLACQASTFQLLFDIFDELHVCVLINVYI